MNIDVDKIVVSLDVVAPDAVVVEASAVAPSGIVTEAVAELPTQVIVISHEETPTVTPLQIIDFGYSSIECAFDVTTEQADEVVKGVLCGTINPPTFENADYRLLHGQGNMDLAFAGLHQNTEYYLRPYALSNFGYKYGDVVAQRTKYNPIPDEYQLVEYLQSSGTQFIDLNYVNSQGTHFGYSIELSVVAYSSESTYIGYIYPTYAILTYNTNRIINWLNGADKGNIIIDGGKHTFSANFLNDGCSIIDGVVKSQNNIDFVSARTRLLLFNGAGADDSIYIGAIGLIYHAQISANNEIVRDVYPVYRKSDNKPGMYDIVNNQFYTNQGTGEFTVGPDKEWEEQNNDEIPT